MYNPETHAIQLGLRVVEGNPGEGLRGLWIGNKTIVIRKGLTRTQFRCTLAHEIVHAEFDPPYIPRDLHKKAEARADRIAAQRLIKHNDFIRLSSMYEDLSVIAHELEVTPKILMAYIKGIGTYG